MTEPQAMEAILAQERRALDQWAQGQPRGYVEIMSSDATYFDDIGAHKRVDGIAAIREYFASLEGKIPPHRYQVVDPKAQIYGEVAILTFRYEPSAVDGKPLTRWKATSVYRRTDDGWRLVHGHWSIVKEP